MEENNKKKSNSDPKKQPLKPLIYKAYAA